MEQCRNARVGEKRDIPEKNPPTSGIMRNDSQLRKPGANQLRIEPGSPWWEVSSPTSIHRGPETQEVVRGRKGSNQGCAPMPLSFPRSRGRWAVRLLTCHQGEPGSVPGRVTPGTFACGNRAGRCHWSAGFSRGSPASSALAILQSHLISPASALKTSLLRAAQISPLTHSPAPLRRLRLQGGETATRKTRSMPWARHLLLPVLFLSLSLLRLNRATVHSVPLLHFSTVFALPLFTRHQQLCSCSVHPGVPRPEQADLLRCGDSNPRTSSADHAAAGPPRASTQCDAKNVRKPRHVEERMQSALDKFLGRHDNSRASVALSRSLCSSYVATRECTSCACGTPWLFRFLRFASSRPLSLAPSWVRRRLRTRPGPITALPQTTRAPRRPVELAIGNKTAAREFQLPTAELFVSLRQLLLLLLSSPPLPPAGDAGETILRRFATTLKLLESERECVCVCVCVCAANARVNILQAQQGLTCARVACGRVCYGGGSEQLRGAGMSGGKGNGRSPEKTRRPTASSGTIPACEKSGVTRPGIEPGSPWWEASKLTAQPPWPPERVKPRIESVP
ncbi:hypothetical protein PR048_011604 [Dryococelus australis]|uniref:Transmembrane protein n=1 Tax=Dryococelus australis TaxID=614101 RepID=A0ABQ9HM36_9NEOP|nr:hypothetical protein PR048_011604 [Dryococelus australis]